MATLGERRRRTRKRVSRSDDDIRVDKHVGQRVRERRVLQGMSQERLSDQLGLTFQQVQKYEKGANRMGASRLAAVAGILDVSVEYFFEDDSGRPIYVQARGKGRGHAKSNDPDNVFARRETLEMVRYYYGCPPAVRKDLFSLMKTSSKAAA